jgi:hypothetical protein
MVTGTVSGKSAVIRLFIYVEKTETVKWITNSKQQAYPSYKVQSNLFYAPA